MLSEEEKKERQREHARKWREKNREALKERSREYRANLSPEEAERQRVARRERQLRNKDRRRETNRRCYEKTPEIWILSNIRKRCRDNGIPFNLTVEDIKAPEFCPVLGIKLERNHKGRESGPQYCSPSVDRIIPELGYVKGNVIVVSHLANAIKQNATPEQIRKVADFYDRLINGKAGGESDT